MNSMQTLNLVKEERYSRDLQEEDQDLERVDDVAVVLLPQVVRFGLQSSELPFSWPELYRELII